MLRTDRRERLWVLVLAVMLFGGLATPAFASGDVDRLEAQKIEYKGKLITVIVPEGSAHDNIKIECEAPEISETRVEALRGKNLHAFGIEGKLDFLPIADLFIYGIQDGKPRINVSEFNLEVPIIHVLILRRRSQLRFFDKNFKSEKDVSNAPPIGRWVAAKSIVDEKEGDETIKGLRITNYNEVEIGGQQYYTFSVLAWPPDDMESADGG